MPITPTFPGVYIEELRSGVRTISSVATSVTAFVGYTARGLDNRAKRLFSFADFERNFGGLTSDSELSYAVKHFFDNGGGEAYVVRVPKSADATVAAADRSAAAGITLFDAVSGTQKQALKFTALSKGAWANNVVIDVDYDGAADNSSFNLTITDLSTGTVETFSNVTMDGAKTSYVVAVVNDEDNGSQLVKVEVPDNTAGRPAQTGTVSGNLTMNGLITALTDVSNRAISKQKWTIKITAAKTAAVNVFANVDVTFLDDKETVPGSMLGICRLLERKVNQALSLAGPPGARIRSIPGNSGAAIRVFADFDQSLHPDTLDANITFAAGASAPESVLDTLKLGTDATSNVAHYWLGKGRTALAQTGAAAGADGKVLPKTQELIGSPSAFTGIYALDKVDLFNILCIPDATRSKPGDPNQLDSGNVDPNAIFAAAYDFCEKKRAFLVVDPPPGVRNVDTAADWKTSGLKVRGKNAAAYFPRIRVPDPLNNFQLRTFAPSGLVAGLYARTDIERGVWKAPAGTDAALRGVQGLVYQLTDPENGALNPLGLNCLRNFPVYGHVAWGARTLEGADAEASEWKYVPVRRLALFIEESLYRGTKWVVFEPNDEPLWAQIRLNIGAFMQSLFLQGAFQGKTPREAYQVKCDKTTTTQNDIDRGIVNIVVGFAPLKPAEFVIIKIQQLAGQLQA
jgi:phage tail sheath protein FI